jgi:hypothetical protein
MHCGTNSVRSMSNLFTKVIPARASCPKANALEDREFLLMKPAGLHE